MTDLPLGVSFPEAKPKPAKPKATPGGNGNEPEMGPLPYEESLQATTPLTEGENVIPAKGANPKPTISTWADLAESIGPIEWDWPPGCCAGRCDAGGGNERVDGVRRSVSGVPRACHRGDAVPDGDRTLTLTRGCGIVRVSAGANSG